jgi:uncharacterized cupredoxin-like copper-binding protein
MKRFLALAALFLIGSLANAQVRIACGQNVPYTDSNGNVWQADTDYNIGAPSINWPRTFSTTHAISGTFDPSLYQHERWSSNDSPALTYTIPAPAGPYTLNLLFSEDFATAAGQRTFNVLINGTQLLTNFDIFATAGGEFIANTQSFNVISTGTVVIQFTHGTANNPEINAIDLEPGTPQPFIWTMPGLGVATFTMFVPPSCGPNDGTCSIQMQACDTSVTPPNCVTTSQGTLALIKTFSLPTQQTTTTQVVTVVPPSGTASAAVKVVKKP